MPIVPSLDQIAEMRRTLAAADPALARADAATPPFQWRLRPGGYEGLLWMIVGQQVSVASATAIWGRVVAGLGGQAKTERALALDIEALRALGLSRPKALYAHEIARAEAEGRLDLARLATLPDDEATAMLTAIRGIGRWTAETYLMFCEGRLDVFPGADVALQEAIRWADGASVRLDQKGAEARALTWRPYRSVAAHLLWAWYGGVKRGEIVLERAMTGGEATTA